MAKIKDKKNRNLKDKNESKLNKNSKQPFKGKDKFNNKNKQMVKRTSSNSALPTKAAVKKSQILGRDKINKNSSNDALLNKAAVKKSKINKNKQIIKNTPSNDTLLNKTEVKEIQLREETKPQSIVSGKDQKLENEKTIFIGNLPVNTKKRQLAKLLDQYGKMIKCRFRRSNGKKILNKMKLSNTDNIIAYAVMDSKESADKCLILNGTEFKNCHIRVTKLDENYIKNLETTKKTIFVGNLKYSATDEKLYEIFSSCGKIQYVRTLNSENGCKGCAYVCFEKPESIGLALELDKTLLDDRPIHVEKYSVKKVATPKKKTTKLPTGFERRMMKKMAKELGHKLEPLKVHVKKAGKILGKGKKVKNEIKSKKIKKPKYRGKKVDNTTKMRKKSKKQNHLQDLAKKIAPKNL